MKNLTIEEQNFIKDMLKHIGGDDDFNEEFAKAMGKSVSEFDAIADSIFNKLQNGRLTLSIK